MKKGVRNRIIFFNVWRMRIQRSNHNTIEFQGIMPIDFLLMPIAVEFNW